MSDIIGENSPETDEIPIEPVEETPIVEAVFTVNEASQKQFLKNVRLGAVIVTVFGALLAVAYVVLSVVGEMSFGDEALEIPWGVMLVLLLIGGLCLAFGIALLFSVRRAVQSAAKTNAVNTYKFFKEYVLISSTQNGEDVGQVKCYYMNFAKVRENKKYFMLYPTPSTVYLVEKRTLTEEQRARIDSVLPLQG